mgnify:CR=1 FL=1
MLHLAALLLLSIGCVLGVQLFSHAMRDRLEAYAALQDSYRVVSDVSLVINRNVSRMQVGFQHMLLASSPGDLAAAEETIRESMDTVRRAAALGGAVGTTNPGKAWAGYPCTSVPPLSVCWPMNPSTSKAPSPPAVGALWHSIQDLPK